MKQEDIKGEYVKRISNNGHYQIFTPKIHVNDVLMSFFPMMYSLVTLFRLVTSCHSINQQNTQCQRTVW